MALCYIHPSLPPESQPWGWSSLHSYASDLREVFQRLGMPPIYSGPGHAPAGRDLSASTQTEPGHVLTWDRLPAPPGDIFWTTSPGSLGKSLACWSQMQPAYQICMGKPCVMSVYVRKQTGCHSPHPVPVSSASNENKWQGGNLTYMDMYNQEWACELQDRRSLTLLMLLKGCLFPTLGFGDS